MEVVANRPGVEVKYLTDQDQECHVCGKVGRPRYLVYLSHLCQHYFAVCEGECKDFVEDCLRLSKGSPQS
jgi:hypothetical protein